MDKSIDVDVLKAEAQKLLRLTIRIRKYHQFLNFIRQPKNWLAIALNIAAVAVCAWSIRYGLSRPFDFHLSSFAMIFGILGIVVMNDVHRSVNTGDTPILAHIMAKYRFPIIFFFTTLVVLFASSFQNVDARSWKFDRGTGNLVERVVFIRPGSTLEREYFVVERKPQKEISVWIWFPAVKDSGWSYERKGYSFREKVVLTFNFKNYRAYKMIHGIKFPEIPLYALSRAQAPGYIMSGVLSYIGLASEDVDIIKIDGLE